VLPNKINWLSIINNLAAQKNNVVAAQNYEFSCPNLRQHLLFNVLLFYRPKRSELDLEDL
jgi:hypothetical protein